MPQNHLHTKIKEKLIGNKYKRIKFANTEEFQKILHFHL